MRRELSDLEDQRARVSAENDKLQGHAARFEREKSSCQSENEKSLIEKDKVEGEHCQLLERLDQLRE